MPTTFVGLIIFVALLVPGFISYTNRRRLAPTAPLSGLVEVGTLATTSLVANSMVLIAFGVIRLICPTITPDVEALFSSRQRGSYVDSHLALVGAWALGALLGSSLLAFLSSTNKIRKLLPGSPLIIDSSAWYHMFEFYPSKAVFLGIDLRDGSFLSGGLHWYSTNLEETGDREIVLGQPLHRTVNGETSAVSDYPAVIVSARDIARLYVTYVDALED